MLVSRHSRRPRRVSTTSTERRSSGRTVSRRTTHPSSCRRSRRRLRLERCRRSVDGQLDRAGPATEAGERGEHVEPPERQVPLGTQVAVDEALELGGDRLQLAPRQHTGRVESRHGCHHGPMGDVDPQAVNAMVEDRFPGSTSRCVAIGPDFALCHMVVDRGLLRPGGYIAGPTQFAAADSALWYLTFARDRSHRTDGAHVGAVDPLPPPGDRRGAVGASDAARCRTAQRRRFGDGVGRRQRAPPSAVAQGTYVLPREPTVTA